MDGLELYRKGVELRRELGLPKTSELRMRLSDSLEKLREFVKDTVTPAIILGMCIFAFEGMPEN